MRKRLMTGPDPVVASIQRGQKGGRKLTRHEDPVAVMICQTQRAEFSRSLGNPTTKVSSQGPHDFLVARVGGRELKVVRQRCLKVEAEIPSRVDDKELRFFLLAGMSAGNEGK